VCVATQLARQASSLHSLPMLANKLEAHPSTSMQYSRTGTPADEVQINISTAHTCRLICMPVPAIQTSARHAAALTCHASLPLPFQPPLRLVSQVRNTRSDSQLAVELRMVFAPRPRGFTHSSSGRRLRWVGRSITMSYTPASTSIQASGNKCLTQRLLVDHTFYTPAACPAAGWHLRALLCF